MNQIVRSLLRLISSIFKKSRSEKIDPIPPLIEKIEGTFLIAYQYRCRLPRCIQYWNIVPYGTADERITISLDTLRQMLEVPDVRYYLPFCTHQITVIRTETKLNGKSSSTVITMCQFDAEGAAMLNGDRWAIAVVRLLVKNVVIHGNFDSFQWDKMLGIFIEKYCGVHPYVFVHGNIITEMHTEKRTYSSLDDLNPRTIDI